MNRSFGLALAAVVILGLALGAGVAAYQGGGGQAAAQAPRSAASGPPAAAGNTGARPGGDGALVLRSGTIISGTVTAASETSLTVKAADGERTVGLTGETTYRQSRLVAPADLKPGETVVATGERAADGTLAARTIQVSQAAEGQRGAARAGAGGQARAGAAGPQSFGRDAGAGLPAAAGTAGAGGPQGFGRDGGAVFGTIKEVGPASLTVEGPNGSTKLTVTPQTQVRRQEAAEASDLKPGTPVVVTVRTGEATPTAMAVQIGE